MDKKDGDKGSSNLWTRRSNNSKLSLSMSNKSAESHDPPASAKRFGSGALSSHGKSNPFNTLGPVSTAAVASPTGSSGASSAFGLGSGAFGFSSAGKTPKTPGPEGGKMLEKKDSSDDVGKESTKRPTPRKTLSSARSTTALSATNSDSSASAVLTSARDPAQPWPLRHTWIIYYRPPTSKNSDYEKSILPLCRISTAQDFWKVYAHLRRPSDLPTVSDYHFFREGIRPVWEDEENRQGGKWIMRVKKGVADRYWENLLLGMIGDQFGDNSGDEVNGAVVSMRSGEDVFSVWTKNAGGGRNLKIRETLRRELSLPSDTNLQWRSHDESITQKFAVDQARQEKAASGGGGVSLGDKRRNTLSAKNATAGDGAVSSPTAHKS